MGVVVRLSSGPYCSSRAHQKSSRRSAPATSSFPRTRTRANTPDSEIETEAIDEIAKDNISRTIIFYANQMLRTIALCYQEFESWAPTGVLATLLTKSPMKCSLNRKHADDFSILDMSAVTLV